MGLRIHDCPTGFLYLVDWQYPVRKTTKTNCERTEQCAANVVRYDERRVERPEVTVSVPPRRSTEPDPEPLKLGFFEGS